MEVPRQRLGERMKNSLIALSALVAFFWASTGISARSQYSTGTLIELPVHTSTDPNDMTAFTPHLIGADCWGTDECGRDAALIAVLPDHARVMVGFCSNEGKQFGGISLSGGVDWIYSCSMSHVLMLTKPDRSHVLLVPGNGIPPHKFAAPGLTVQYRLETEDGKTLYRIKVRDAHEKDIAYSVIQLPLLIKAGTEDQMRAYFRSLCNTDKLSPGMEMKYCSKAGDAASPGTAPGSKK